jgi:hypothetical protein
VSRIKIIHTALVFIIAVLTAFLLSSIIGTQIIIADLQGFGLDVSLSDRLAATIHDIYGLALTLPILISVAFLVAFGVAALGNRFVGGKRMYWYLAAGFTSVPAALMLIKSLMGGTLFAAARSGYGMFLIALCSLAGGWVFARLTQRKNI